MKLPEDPFVRELLPEFVDSWINDLNEQFQPLVEQKKGDDLYRLAHTLKGSCFQFGLDDIAEMGIELMNYAKDRDWEKAVEMEKQLKDSFQKVKEFLEEENKG